MYSMKEMATFWSTYVVAFLMAVVGYWFTLTPAEQAALQASYPWLGKIAPVFGFLSFYFARAKVQEPPASPPPKEGS